MKERFFPIPLEQELTAVDGSRLAAPFTLEDAASMGFTLESPCVAPVYVAGVCDSTFDVAWELCRTHDMPPWSAVLAASQTSGRGQLRRKWVSPPGNLYVSFFLPPDMGCLENMAPLAVGFCIHCALRDMGITTRLKWPNDILLCENGKEGKFGGLLLEERKNRILAGLGLNLRSAPDDEAMRKNRAVPAVSLSGFNGSAFTFWLMLAERMRDAHAREIAGVPRDILRRRVESSLAWLGQPVHAEELGVQGLVRGLDADGSLLLQTDTGLATVSSGSVSPV